MDDCIFCKIASKKIPSDILYEDTDLVAFPDIGPQAPTHILIVPKRHVSDIMAMTAADRSWWDRIPAVAQEIAKKQRVDAGGFRLVVNCGANGGQAVAHVHVHLLGGRKLSWPPG